MADFVGGPMPGPIPGLMPGMMGGGFGEFLNYNPSWIYGKSVSGGDSYAAQREPYDFSDEKTLETMYENDKLLENKNRAEISKKLYSINKLITPLTENARKNYAKILILQKMDELEAKYGKLSIPTSEISASEIQKRIYEDLCVKKERSSEFGAKPKLSPSTEFYNPEEEREFIESFIKKVFNKRKNTKWRYDTLLNSGNEFQHYFNCLTGYAYHNYNVYKKMLGLINVDLDNPNFDLSEPMYPGMLPDLIDETAVEKKYEERRTKYRRQVLDNALPHIIPNIAKDILISSERIKFGDNEFEFRQLLDMYVNYSLSNLRPEEKFKIGNKEYTLSSFDESYRQIIANEVNKIINSEIAANVSGKEPDTNYLDNLFANDYVSQLFDKFPKEEQYNYAGEYKDEFNNTLDYILNGCIEGKKNSVQQTNNNSINNTNPQPVNVNSQPVNTNSQPVNTNSQPVNVNPQPVNTNSQPVNVNPQPVNVNPQPVNINPQPVNTNPQPVNVNPQPVNNNTTSRDIDFIDYQDLINGRISQEELSRLSREPQPELEDLGKIVLKQDDIDFWNNLVDEYDKLEKGISFLGDDDTYEAEREKIVSRSRSRDEELIEMLSNLEDDEVDFTPGKGFTR